MRISCSSITILLGAHLTGPSRGLRTPVLTSPTDNRDLASLVTALSPCLHSHELTVIHLDTKELRLVSDRLSVMLCAHRGATHWERSRKGGPRERVGRQSRCCILRILDPVIRTCIPRSYRLPDTGPTYAFDYCMG